MVSDYNRIGRKDRYNALQRAEAEYYNEPARKLAHELYSKFHYSYRQIAALVGFSHKRVEKLYPKAIQAKSQ